jgi:hypothetical protein
VTSSPFWYLWLVAFGITVLLEAPVVLWLLRPSEASLLRRTVLLVVANLATHPLVWFFFPALPLKRFTSHLLSEGWAFTAEMLVYALLVTTDDVPFGKLLVRAALVSALANALSWGLGPAIFRVLALALGG